MHRTNRVLNQAFAGLFLGLLLSGLPMATARAQAPRAATGGGPALIIAINGTQAIQMSTKKKIKSATNSRDIVARIQEVPGDPTKILITGLDAGVSHLVLTDEDGKVEELDVVVQTDVEFLRTQIKRTVPTANVEPIPVSSNTIILKGTVNSPEDIDAIMAIARGIGGNQIYNQMRVAGVQQVQLCVTIAAVSRSEFRAMAFDWVLNRNDISLGSLIGGAGSIGGFVGVGGATSGTLGNPNGAPTNLFFALNKNGTNILTFLQALKTENVVKLLAEPRIVTLSGRPASFLSGGEQAVPIPAGLGQVGVQFEEFGTRVNFLPVILGEGKIHLEVEPEVSALDANFGTTINGTTVPGRKTQRVHTTVEMEDGQTFVIGGLIQRDFTGSTSKVPILGEIPFLAPVFSSNTITETEQELVILVTPHLVDAMSCDQVAGKLLPGQETRTADDFELFLEGILEAPRGQRQINFPCGYQAAYKNSPTASQFPCGVVDDGHGGIGGGCRNGSCGAGACSNGAGTQALSMTPATKGGETVQQPADAVPNSQPTAINSKPTVLPPLPPETNGEKP
ncbi:MAG TPA: BON domain-containing protein [Gemmataceae bacterium]|jgi:pilus assembly protein CpaC